MSLDSRQDPLRERGIFPVEQSATLYPVNLYLVVGERLLKCGPHLRRGRVLKCPAP